MPKKKEAAYGSTLKFEDGDYYLHGRYKTRAEADETESHLKWLLAKGHKFRILPANDAFLLYIQPPDESWIQPYVDVVFANRNRDLRGRK